jgi:hypothetical protein
MNDPFFAWLRPLSGLMADIDEGLDDPSPLVHSHAADARAAVEALLEPPAGAPRDFADAYAALLQVEADLVLAVGHLRRALGRLPVTPHDQRAGARLRWTQTRRRPRPGRAH